MPELTKEQQWFETEEKIRDGISAIEYGNRLLQDAAADLMPTELGDATFIATFVLKCSRLTEDFREEVLSRVIVNDLNPSIDE